MNPARLGANVTGMLNGLGANSLRLSQSFNESWSVSIIGQSINASKGDAKGRQEVMDLNGDRFADLVAENTVTLNTGTAAGFYQPKAIDFTLNDSADIRKIHNRNFQLGITYPPACPRLTTKSRAGPRARSLPRRRQLRPGLRQLPHRRGLHRRQRRRPAGPRCQVGRCLYRAPEPRRPVSAPPNPGPCRTGPRGHHALEHPRRRHQLERRGQQRQHRRELHGL